MQNSVLAWPRAAKRLVVVALDVVLALCATWLSLSLRLDAPNWPEDQQWRVYLATSVLFIPVFVRFGLYRAIFRYTGQAALVATAKAVMAYGAALCVLLVWQQWSGVPRSLGILQPLIFFLLVGASRAFARFWLASLDVADGGRSRKFLIFGAGTAGAQTALAMGVSGSFSLVGFVDDDTHKVGRSVNGVPIFGPASIPSLIEKRGVTDLLLALPSASRSRRKAIVDSLQHLSIHISTLPDWADLANGKVTVQDIKELDIEDLLGRDPVAPQRDLLAKNLFGKVVLVTGAGGSIGSELCRQIVLEQPSRLLLLDHNEYGLYAIHQELERLCRDRHLTIHLEPLLGSVGQAARLRTICQFWSPHTVYHAAAYKHVPLVESNPVQGVENNVLGTLYMAQVAVECGVTSFVLVSTDKAVRPTNVMGASKRMAELVLQALASRQAATCFSMVRFGNVLGSSGSVVPLFRKQLAMGGPLTVTHPDVTRYFMTIPEAAQLVLQAGAMAQSGEVFVLDMGEPVRIMDLAQRMIELSGLRVRDSQCPDGDIAIDVTGLRPGEKLYEELLIGGTPSPTRHPRILMAHEDALSWAELEVHLARLQQAIEGADVAAIKSILQDCVQGYEAKLIGD